MTLPRALALAILVLTLVGPPARAQDTLSVEPLQEAALKSDPRVRQRDLLRAATDLRLAVIGSDRLPRVTFNGKATHQSDVTRPTFNVPNFAVPEFPKDRWETTLDVNARSLLQVKVSHTESAEEVFSTLMGDLVEPRRDFIQQNALSVANLDV